MSRQVQERQLTLTGTPLSGSLSVPQGARIAGVDNVGTTLTLWFEVETTRPNATRNFVVYGNDTDVTGGYSHVATRLINGIARHLYEVTV